MLAHIRRYLSQRKTTSKRQLIYRLHPARLLYLFTIALGINVFWTTIQFFIFAASYPFPAFNFNQLLQTFYLHTYLGRAAETHPAWFWSIFGISIVVTILGWYIDYLYRAEKKRKEIWERSRKNYQNQYEQKIIEQVKMVEACKLRREDFNLGDNSAAYFPYITTPVKQAYDTALMLLFNIGTGTKNTKQGILVLGEANAGKTRLALEALIAVLPQWLVLFWRPGYSSHNIPISSDLEQHNVAIFVDDLQMYVPSGMATPEKLDSLSNNLEILLDNKFETLRILLSKVRASAKLVVVIATCREENERHVQARLNDLFESLELIRIPHFNPDPSSAEAAQIIDEFEKQGAKYRKDWDGNIGSLLLGLSRKKSLYNNLAINGEVGIFILRAMKLLTLARTTEHTTDRLSAICVKVFGVQELKQNTKAWRLAVEKLKQLQFVKVEQDDFDTILIVRKDIYFEEVIGDYSQDDAEQDFSILQRALIDLKDIEALTYLGSVYLERKWYQSIISLADEALTIDPNNVPLLVLKGISCLSRGGPYRPAEALRAFNQALEFDPDDPFVLSKRGIAHMNLGQYQEALCDFDSSIDLNPDDIKIKTLKGRALKEMERYQEALCVFDQVLKLDSANPEVWSYKAHVLKSLNQLEEALCAFNNALDIDPERADIWYDKAITLRALRRIDDALAAFNRALEINSDDPDAWHGKGNVCLMLGKYEDGLAALEHALAFDSENVHILFDKGLALAGQKRYEEAVVILNRVSELDPTYDNNIEYFKGASLRLSGRYEEAIVALNSAIKRDSENIDAWFDKGLVHGTMEQYKEAVEALEHALILDPDAAHIWYVKGVVLRTSNRNEEALAAFRHALTLDQDNNDILEEIAYLEAKDAGIADNKASRDAKSSDE